VAALGYGPTPERCWTCTFFKSLVTALGAILLPKQFYHHCNFSPEERVELFFFAFFLNKCFFYSMFLRQNEYATKITGFLIP
jgi:hypothetical protein